MHKYRCVGRRPGNGAHRAKMVQILQLGRANGIVRTSATIFTIIMIMWLAGRMRKIRVNIHTVQCDVECDYLVPEICVHNFKYTKQIAVWEVRAGFGFPNGNSWICRSIVRRVHSRDLCFSIIWEINYKIIVQPTNEILLRVIRRISFYLPIFTPLKANTKKPLRDYDPFSSSNVRSFSRTASFSHVCKRSRSFRLMRNQLFIFEGWSIIPNRYMWIWEGWKRFC